MLEIQPAIDVLQHHKPNIAKYSIKVIRKGDSVFIALISPEESLSTQKILGVSIEYKTELSTKSLTELLSDLRRVQVLDKIQGRNFLVAQVAAGVFQSYDPHFTQYKIEVWRDKQTIVVVFADEDRADGTRGSTGKLGFEVELDDQDLRGLRSNFVR